MDVITEVEAVNAIKALKNNKVTEPDQIQAELLKHGGTSTIPALTRLLNVQLARRACSRRMEVRINSKSVKKQHCRQ